MPIAFVTPPYEVRLVRTMDDVDVVRLTALPGCGVVGSVDVRLDQLHAVLDLLQRANYAWGVTRA